MPDVCRLCPTLSFGTGRGPSSSRPLPSCLCGRFEGTVSHGKPHTGRVISSSGCVTRRFDGGFAFDVDELVEFEIAVSDSA